MGFFLLPTYISLKNQEKIQIFRKVKAKINKGQKIQKLEKSNKLRSKMKKPLNFYSKMIDVYKSLTLSTQCKLTYFLSFKFKHYFSKT